MQETRDIEYTVTQSTNTKGLWFLKADNLILRMEIALKVPEKLYKKYDTLVALQKRDKLTINRKVKLC